MKCQYCECEMSQENDFMTLYWCSNCGTIASDTGDNMWFWKKTSILSRLLYGQK